MKCTPQYNQETRELMRRREDLRRVEKASESGDFRPVIRAKANEFIDAGHGAQDVADKVHAYVNEFAPHTPEEVVKAIATTERKAPTENQARRQREAIKAELRDLHGLNEPKADTPRTPMTPEQKIVLRERALEKEIDDLNAGIVERGKGPPLDSARIRELKAERDRLANEKRPSAVAADAAKQATLRARIAEIDRLLAGGKPEGPTHTADSEATADLIAKRDAKQAELDAARAEREPTPEDRKVAQLEKQLADLVAGKERPGATHNRPDTQRIAEARDALERAREAREEARPTAEDRKVKELEKKLADLQAGKPKEGARANRPESERVTKAREELAAARKAAAEARKPTQDASRNKARQTVLKKRLAEIERRFRDNDFSKPEGRGEAPAYSDDTLALQRQLNVAQRRVDGLIARQGARNRSLPWKIGNLIHNIHLGFILTSVAVYPKLLGAVLSHWVMSPAQDLVTSAARLIPGVRKWADAAPRHGQGFVLDAQKEFVRGIGKGAQGAAQQMLRGSSDLEDTFGTSANASNEFTDFVGEIGDAVATKDYLHVAKVLTSIPGRTHAFVKEFASQPEFYKAFFLRDKHMRADLAKRGHSQEQINEFMARESTKALIGARAYCDSLEAKFQGKNRFADSVNLFIGRMDTGSPVEQAIGFALKTIFPIRKIPMNIIKGVSSYAFGGIKAATRAHLGEFNEENAEYIMKNIAKQGVGIALFAIGYAMGPALGGTPQPGDNKRHAKVKAGAASVLGIDVDKGWMHGDAAQVLQLGAGYRRLYEQDYGHSHDAIHAGVVSLSDNLSSTTVHGVPYFDYVDRTYKTVRYGRGWGEVAGNQIRSMVEPTMLQQEAKREDPLMQGDTPKYRKPQGIADDLKLGIPGLRETVPVKNPRHHKGARP